MTSKQQPFNMDLEKYIFHKQFNDKRNTYNKTPSKYKTKKEPKCNCDISRNTYNVDKDCVISKIKDVVSCPLNKSDKHFLHTLKRKYSKRIIYNHKQDIPLVEFYKETVSPDNSIDLDFDFGREYGGLQGNSEKYRVLHGKSEEHAKFRELQKAILRWKDLPISPVKPFPDHPYLYHAVPNNNFYRGQYHL